MKEHNLILDKTFNFSLQIIELYKILVKNNEYVISRQILKSATSIGANAEEATAAQSKKDFIAKMTIASKEARETKYWLRLLDKSQFVKYDFKNYLNEIESIVNIITAIVKTSQIRINK